MTCEKRGGDRLVAYCQKLQEKLPLETVISLGLEAMNGKNDNMTKEEQRIAIAEACGWPDKLAKQIGGKQHLDECYTKDWRVKNTDGNIGDSALPDYLNDLNAMHKAEKLLIEQDRWERYEDELCVILCHQNEFPQELVHATASQRAEAFLRTINK